MKDIIHGGKADNRPDSDFDMKNILKGMKVEREHTTDKRIQKEIAKDHLTEDPQYYQKLEKMEKGAEEDRVTPYHLSKIEKAKKHEQEQLMNHYDKHFASIGISQAPAVLAKPKKKMEKKAFWKGFLNE